MAVVGLGHSISGLRSLSAAVGRAWQSEWRSVWNDVYRGRIVVFLHRGPANQDTGTPK